MTIRITLYQAFLIVIISTILGFANHLVNPNRTKLSIERPKTPTVDDSTFESGRPAKMNGPVVLAKEQLLKLIQNGDVIIVDARTSEEYAVAHIPDAINIPFEQLGDFIQQVDEFAREKWLVPYCDGPPCEKGKELADIFFEMGFGRVAYYDAGLDDWKTTEEVEQ